MMFYRPTIWCRLLKFIKISTKKTSRNGNKILNIKLLGKLQSEL